MLLALAQMLINSSDWWLPLDGFAWCHVVSVHGAISVAVNYLCGFDGSSPDDSCDDRFLPEGAGHYQGII